MLTLILLVVLGGGAGLMAVWLVDARGLSRLLGRDGGRSLRRTRAGDTTPPPAPAPATPERRFEPLEPVEPVGGATLVEEPVLAPVDAPPALPRADDRRITKVPAAYTAVEGPYRQVARVPAWRKLASLVSLLAVLVVVGVAIAALAGASFGVVSELVDSAVG